MVSFSSSQKSLFMSECRQIPAYSCLISAKGLKCVSESAGQSHWWKEWEERRGEIPCLQIIVKTLIRLLLILALRVFFCLDH